MESTWNQSNYPFHVVIKDKSTLKKDHESVSENLFSTRSIFPEVKYIFSDDDFSPTTELIEQRPGDISVLVDFDSNGENVVRCESLSTSWQVTKLSTSPNIGSWTHEEKSSTNSIFIEGVGSFIGSMAGKDQLSNSPRLEDQVERISTLIKVFQERNEQLREVLDQSRGQGED